MKITVYKDMSTPTFTQFCTYPHTNIHIHIHIHKHIRTYAYTYTHAFAAGGGAEGGLAAAKEAVAAMLLDKVGGCMLRASRWVVACSEHHGRWLHAQSITTAD
jgi:hypothetical protein